MIDYHELDDQIHLAVMTLGKIYIIDQYSKQLVLAFNELLEPQNFLILAPNFDVYSVPLVIMRERQCLRFVDASRSGMQAYIYNLPAEFKLLGQVERTNTDNDFEYVLVGISERGHMSFLTIKEEVIA